jgi:signal transduction histidine kinase
VVIDITERKRDEIEVQRATRNLEVRLGEDSETSTQQPRELRRLAAQLTQAELAERKRIAGLLHDTVQQTLVAAILGAEKARRQISNAGARDTLLKVITAIQEVVARTRLLSIQLDPPVLAQSTLSESLRWLAASKREHYGLQVTFQESAEPAAPSEEVKFFLFEAARELLFNVVKHGGVLAASMSLTAQDGALCLSIDDEGQGCNLDLLGDASGEHGLGLAMIRDRAAMLGGEVSLSSAPDAGFHVRIRVPLDD